MDEQQIEAATRQRSPFTGVHAWLAAVALASGVLSLAGACSLPWVAPMLAEPVTVHVDVTQNDEQVEAEVSVDDRPLGWLTLSTGAQQGDEPEIPVDNKPAAKEAIEDTSEQPTIRDRLFGYFQKGSEAASERADEKQVAEDTAADDAVAEQEPSPAGFTWGFNREPAPERDRPFDWLKLYVGLIIAASLLANGLGSFGIAKKQWTAANGLAVAAGSLSLTVMAILWIIAMIMLVITVFAVAVIVLPIMLLMGGGGGG